MKKLWCAVFLFGFALVIHGLHGWVAVSAQSRIVEMPKSPAPQQDVCRCGPDCSCCDDFDLKRKR